MKKIWIPILFVVLILLIQFGFVQLEKEVEEFNNTEVAITIENGISSNDAINITMDISQQWNDWDENRDPIVGAQYDGVIMNTGEYVFRDWKLVLDMPQEGNIDSLWNGVHTYEGDTLTITPMDYNIEVEPNDQQTYGFICISKQLLEFDHIQISGYFEKEMKDTDGYSLLQTLQRIWLIAVVSYIAVQICLISYKRRHKRDQKIVHQTIDTFVSFIDAKDPYTHGHSQRVAIYTKEIASRMGLSKEEVQNYFYIGLLHDCGKLGVPDSILKKPTKLTADERAVIESHTKVGADILKNFTAIPGIQNGALQHHERYDGTGYPNKLKGTDISLVGRILCVTDAYDAMNSDRCYRKKLPIEKIKSELETNAGTQFDPEVVAYMLDIINEGVADELIKDYI
ncbi:MAG: HD domain-containing protein [Lachnospiraceae bacterium]|nr:HD domain-containing protein [Lachnospiraceae bacterium]